MTTSYLETLFGLRDKVAVLFGGTGELVGAIGAGYARAGMRVVLCGRKPEKASARIAAVQALDSSAELSFCACDVGDPNCFEQVLCSVLEQHGRVDVVVNGVGMNSATPFLEIRPEDWEEIMTVNLTSVLRSAQTFGGYFLDHKLPGAIINITSISSNLPLSRVFAYSASKAALLNLTRNLAREWAPHGIRVNALTPGFFPAEQNRKVLDRERIDSILAHTPLSRFGVPDELIGAALLLASNKTGSFIVGSELVVDGGFSIVAV